jgi:hypothetical protein
MKIGRTVSGRLTLVAAAGALAAAAGLAGALATGPAASASPPATKAAAVRTPTWHMQAPPEPAGTIQQAATAVSCSSSSACLAIAINAYPHSTDLGTFAETWNGSHWTVRSVPNGRNNAGLNGVKCRSAHWCMAVGVIKAVPPTGDYVPVADRWNGRAWAQVKPPVPADATTGELAAVACTGTTACTAVGSSVKGGGAPRPLAERWNGSAWKVQPAPAPPAGGGQLAAVACPAADACRAVGSDNKGLFSEVWNGSSWLIRPVPVPAGGSFAELNGVSCTAADFCEAVGSYEQGSTFLPLAEAWNGSHWHLQAPSTVSGEPSAGLNAVSCVSATDCEAAGDAGAKEGPQEVGVLEKWNGTRWSVQEKVRPAGDLAARLNGISCTAGPVCEAVGWHEKSIPNSDVLALRYSS